MQQIEISHTENFSLKKVTMQQNWQHIKFSAMQHISQA